MHLNNDVELENGSLARLVEILDSDPNYSMAVPRLLQWSGLRFLDGVGDAILLFGGAYRVGHGELDFSQYETPEPVFSACAAAALYRRSLSDDIGSFDQDFSPTAKMWISLARSAPRTPLHFCAEGPHQTSRQRHPPNYLSSLDRSAHHSQLGSYDSQELSSLFSPSAAVVCFSGSLAGGAGAGN